MGLQLGLGYGGVPAGLHRPRRRPTHSGPSVKFAVTTEVGISEPACQLAQALIIPSATP
jgi:hypothetical protein